MKKCPKCNVDHEKPGIFCSRKCANSRIATDESNQKRSVALKETQWSDARKQKLSHSMAKVHAEKGRGKTFSKCLHCTKLINTHNKYGMCRDCFIQSDVSLEVRGHHYKKYKRQRVKDSLGNEILLMSSLEIRYFEYLTKHNLIWKKPQCIKYVDGDGKHRWYRPDFHLVDTDEIIEIKGHWWNNDKNKMQFVYNQHPDLKIKVLMKTDLDNLFP